MNASTRMHVESLTTDSNCLGATFFSLLDVFTYPKLLGVSRRGEALWDVLSHFIICNIWLERNLRTNEDGYVEVEGIFYRAIECLWLWKCGHRVLKASRLDPLTCSWEEIIGNDTL